MTKDKQLNAIVDETRLSQFCVCVCVCASVLVLYLVQNGPSRSCWDEKCTQLLCPQQIFRMPLFPATCPPRHLRSAKTAELSRPVGARLCND